MTTRAILIALCVVVMLQLPAHAHRVGTPVTQIEWNERAKTWEIVHRLSVHDAEDVLAPGTDIGSLAQSELNSAVADYIQSRFHILGLMSLSFIGAEVEGDTIWAYYELSGTDQTVVLLSQLLLETDATSVALVNVETANGRQSFSFDANSDWRGLKLHRPGFDGK